MLNIPLTIGDLHCRSRALRILNRWRKSGHRFRSPNLCVVYLGCEAAGELLGEISGAEGAHHGGCST